MNDTVDFDSGRLAAAARRRWQLIALVMLVGGALGLGAAALTGPRYVAEAKVLVGQPITLATLTSTAPSGVDQTRLVNYAQQKLTSRDTGRQIEERLGVGEDDYDLKVAGASNNNVLRIEVEAGSAGEAQRLANAFARAHVSEVKEQNLARVTRAERQVRADIARTEELAAQVQRVGGNPAAQLAALVTLQGRLDQIELARTVDPAGGAEVVQAAEPGEKEPLGALGPVALGALLGLLLGLGLVAVIDGGREPRGRRRADAPATTLPPLNGHRAEGYTDGYAVERAVR